ncbi:hypothetical protein LCGC14_1945230 [marine sediment metagenome]|uniref:Helicase ATP-binding domain-containing protein n=1 Tax=marine sediment metagenome TaxID=412755 RepID=A0A0F9FJE3_9ZZZZ
MKNMRRAKPAPVIETDANASPIDRLRPYQKRDYRDVLARCERVRSVLYVAFMGSGKTVVAAALIRTWLARGERVLIVVHTREILRQTHDKLRAAGIDENQIGWIWRKHPKTNASAPIQLASLDTLVRREFPEGITRLVIDEAHHAPAKKWRSVIDAYPNARVLGLTGTPVRLDGRPLGDVFDEMVESEPTENLIDQGWISRPFYWTPDWGVDLLRQSGRDFTDVDAAEMMTRSVVLKSMVAEYLKHAAHLPALGFAATRDKAVEYSALFSASGIPSDTIFGSDTDLKRQGSLARLRAGKLRVLWTCGVLSEGWDYQGLRCVLLARPTLSLSRCLQQVARCMRPGVPSVVLDLWGAWAVFDPPWVDFGWSLQTKTPRARHAGTRRPDGSVIWQPPLEIDGQLVRADSIGVMSCVTCGAPATRSSAFNARARGTKPYCAKHAGGPIAKKEPLPCAVCGRPSARGSSASARVLGRKAYCAEHSPHKKTLLLCAICGEPAAVGSSRSARPRGSKAYCAKHAGANRAAPKRTLTGEPLPCAVCGEPSTDSSSRSSRASGTKPYCAEHKGGPSAKKPTVLCVVCGKPVTKYSAAIARRKGSDDAYCSDHIARKPILPCLVCVVCGEAATHKSSSRARSKGTRPYCVEHLGGPTVKRPRLPCAMCGKPAMSTSSLYAPFTGEKPYCSAHASS